MDKKWLAILILGALLLVTFDSVSKHYIDATVSQEKMEILEKNNAVLRKQVMEMEPSDDE